MPEVCPEAGAFSASYRIISLRSTIKYLANFGASVGGRLQPNEPAHPDTISSSYAGGAFGPRGRDSSLTAFPGPIHS